MLPDASIKHEVPRKEMGDIKAGKNDTDGYNKPDKVVKSFQRIPIISLSENDRVHIDDFSTNLPEFKLCNDQKDKFNVNLNQLYEGLAKSTTCGNQKMSRLACHTNCSRLSPEDVALIVKNRKETLDPLTHLYYSNFRLDFDKMNEARTRFKWGFSAQSIKPNDFYVRVRPIVYDNTTDPSGKLQGGYQGTYVKGSVISHAFEDIKPVGNHLDVIK